jgi:hypothetical protein
LALKELLAGGKQSAAREQFVKQIEVLIKRGIYSWPSPKLAGIIRPQQFQAS